MSSFRFFPPKTPTWEIHAALWNGVGWSHTYGGDCKSVRNIWNEFFFQHFNEFFFRHVRDSPDTIFQREAIFSVPVKPSPLRNRKCCSFRGGFLWETIPLLLILNNNKMNLRLTIYNFKEKIIKGNLQQIYNIRKDHIFPWVTHIFFRKSIPSL